MLIGKEMFFDWWTDKQILEDSAHWELFRHTKEWSADNHSNPDEPGEHATGRRLNAEGHVLCDSIHTECPERQRQRDRINGC